MRSVGINMKKAGQRKMSIDAKTLRTTSRAEVNSGAMTYGR
jgi:hypothetical protein